jgi:hypothetical protein
MSRPNDLAVNGPMNNQRTNHNTKNVTFLQTSLLDAVFDELVDGVS